MTEVAAGAIASNNRTGMVGGDDEPIADKLAALSDEELEQELTIAASREQRDERYNDLLAELEFRRGDPRD